MLEISQGSHDSTIAALVDIHEIVEIHTITGQGDLLCRIVARSNDHLHEVLQRIAQIETVMRSQTQLALSTPHQRGVLDGVVRRSVVEALVRRPFSRSSTTGARRFVVGDLGADDFPPHA